MTFIDIIPPDKAEGELQSTYEKLREKRGKIARIHQIQSLNPKSLVQHMDYYMTLMYGSSPLKRYQREMLGVVTSAINSCDYCIQHHSHALQHFWKDKELVRKLHSNYREASLSKLDQALCQYAEALTQHPSRISETKYIDPLRKEGLEDRAILDAAQIVSYFNYVNRLVLGLGVQLEDDDGKGYKYE